MITLLLAAVLQPGMASHVASWIAGEPALGPRLERVCRRESRCTRIGVHVVDAHLGRKAWRNAVRAGVLDPKSCKHHELGDDPSRWSTRGAWGTMAAYTMRYLPDPCVPPEVLDVPIVGAYAAARRIQQTRGRRTPALKRWIGR